MSSSRDPGKGRLPPLKEKSLRDMLAQPRKQREVLLSPWIREGDSAMIFAPTGCGKSIFVLAIALTIAGSGKFLGWKAETPRRVLFVDGEMPEADITDRCRMLLPTIAGCDQEQATRNLTFLARQAQHVDSVFPDLGTPEGHNAVLRRATKGGHDLVILDNFSTLAECEDENSAAAFNGIVKFLMRIKQAGIACILIHHSGKKGDDYRGSSKLATTFEALLGLKPDRAAMRNQGTLGFNLEWTKYRGRRDESVVGRSIIFEGCNGGIPQWQFEVSEKEKLDGIVEAVRSCEFATQESLAKHLKISESQLSKLKSRAIHKHGMVTAAEWRECMEAAKENPDTEREF